MMEHKQFLLSVIVILCGIVALGCAKPAIKETPRLSNTTQVPNPTDASAYFRITVVDEATGRGIPCVQITIPNHILLFTDSAGVAAFYEPGLMTNRSLYFEVEADGYSYPKDFLGKCSVGAKAVPGGSLLIKMKRDNIAQRLYRITGPGIYRDSVLLGDKPPIQNPLINSGVMGQDSVQATIYQGRLFWVWGDTGGTWHPIAANYKTTCATSELPANGGLDPEVGVDLSYFQEGDFVKAMVPLTKDGVYWLGGLVAPKDKKGKERLVARYVRIKPPMDTIEQGLVEFDDNENVFKAIVKEPTDSILRVAGYPCKVEENGADYFYFFAGGISRVKAVYESVIDHSQYEAFTCINEGVKAASPEATVDRDEKGAIRYSWKKNASTIGSDELKALEDGKKIEPEERSFKFMDVDGGKEIAPHAHSVFWNPYRQRWVMIVNQMMGTSFMGEIWFAEADTPVGPWMYARKVVSHKGYTFYNPAQHPYFAKDNGRVIFFEGTYTTFLASAPFPTPRYDYNQIMYKLEVDDPRLSLPVPIYRIEGKKERLLSNLKISRNDKRGEIAFYAPDRPSEGMIPVYELSDGLTLTNQDKSAPVAFYGVPADSASPPPNTIFLYEYTHNKNSKRFYSTKESPEDSNYTRQEKPICRVWLKPTEFNPFGVQ